MTEFQLRKGMNNPGSLCYMNAILQQLFNMTEFLLIVSRLSQLDTSQVGGRDVIGSLVHIYKNIESPSPSSVKTLTLYENIQKHLKATIDVDQCRDAADFFSELISVLNTYYSDSQEPLNPLDVMKGSLINIIHANEDPSGKRIVHNERFYYISLPVCGLDNNNLHESLTQFTKAHQFPFKWRDTDGNYMKTPLLSSKSTKFQHLPKYLLFHLKRFKYDSTKKKKCKVFDRFEFPRLFDMSPFVEPVNEESTMTSVHMYSLSGLVIHVGKSAYTGHYYSVLRNYNARIGDSGLGEDEWLVANDEEVLPFPSASLERVFFGSGDDDNSETEDEGESNSSGDDSSDDEDDDSDSNDSEETSYDDISFRDIVDFENTSFFQYHTTQMLVYKMV
jgi:ubiquitin carboxyl-terminal hydrolase 7